MHFPVIVITEKAEEAVIYELLAPYYENLGSDTYMELPYPELKKYLDRFCSSELPPYGSELRDALDADDISALREINDKWGIFDEITEQGTALNTYNPRAKWDFWGFGGRWVSILNGNVECRLKDFPRIRNEDTEAVLKEKFPMIWEGWAEKNEPRPTNSRAFHDFLKAYYCYALLTPSGEWIEPGRYAWWLGTAAEKEENIDWPEKFNPILDSFPQDYKVTLIDCHI